MKKMLVITTYSILKKNIAAMWPKLITVFFYKIQIVLKDYNCSDFGNPVPENRVNVPPEYVLQRKQRISQASWTDLTVISAVCIVLCAQSIKKIN